MKTYSDAIVEAILTPAEIEIMREVHEQCIEDFMAKSEQEPFAYNPWDEMGEAEYKLRELGVFDRFDVQEDEKKDFIEHLGYYYI